MRLMKRMVLAVLVAVIGFFFGFGVAAFVELVF